MLSKKNKKEIMSAFAGYVDRTHLEEILSGDSRQETIPAKVRIGFVLVDTGSRDEHETIRDIKILLESATKSKLISCYITNSFVFLYSASVVNEELGILAKNILSVLPQACVLSGNTDATITNYGGPVHQTYGPIVEGYRNLMTKLLSLKPGELASI